MPLTSQSIRNVLEIKDLNIKFHEDSYLKTVDGCEALIIPAVLTYLPPRCINCGFDNLVKNGFNSNMIIVPSLVHRPTYLALKRQRFLCRECHTTFDAQTNYIWQNYQISQPVRQLILSETARNQSNKDIAQRYHVSDKTVQRIIDEEASQHQQYAKDQLPKHLAFDEFASVDKKMSFIWCDSDRHTIGEILTYRTSRYIKAYFCGFSLKARMNVETITLDLNAGYINLVPELFPNAKVVVDRFHIVQMANRSLNQIRIQVMKTLDKTDKKYKFMKHEWKQFLRPMGKLEKVLPQYHKSVDYYETDLNLVTEGLALNHNFETAYETYQDIMTALRTHNTALFDQTLRAYHQLDNPMDTTIKSFKKYRQQVLNAVESPYSNGYLEGTIGRIKKIKNAAFGFRNWLNYINRIKIQLQWLHPVRQTVRNIKVPRPI
ncbi:ISL3 family transposase [Lactiplantibacillus pentosus]|uniref:ISL3 family transposase n=1 Tax=Lactiplantibacillus TaxID=2767842 RepID=UPI0021A37FD3|nr:ISL3 family transposase [Lactiplantibacillus pentosus]MCT3278379.1 ISL3 family transposase [Lactiplantibacillus pentosus]